MTEEKKYFETPEKSLDTIIPVQRSIALEHVGECRPCIERSFMHAAKAEEVYSDVDIMQMLEMLKAHVMQLDNRDEISRKNLAEQKEVIAELQETAADRKKSDALEDLTRSFNLDKKTGAIIGFVLSAISFILGGATI